MEQPILGASILTISVASYLVANVILVMIDFVEKGFYLEGAVIRLPKVVTVGHIIMGIFFLPGVLFLILLYWFARGFRSLGRGCKSVVRSARKITSTVVWVRK